MELKEPKDLLIYKVWVDVVAPRIHYMELKGNTYITPRAAPQKNPLHGVERNISQHLSHHDITT